MDFLFICVWVTFIYMNIYICCLEGSSKVQHRFPNHSTLGRHLFLLVSDLYYSKLQSEIISLDGEQIRICSDFVSFILEPDILSFRLNKFSIVRDTSNNQMLYSEMLFKAFFKSWDASSFITYKLNFRAHVKHILAPIPEIISSIM